MIWMLSRY